MSQLAQHSGNLDSVYRAKCTALGLRPSAKVSRQLSAVDSTRARCLDLSSVDVDQTFSCVMDIIIVATGIAQIDLSNSRCTDHEVDVLVHHLSRAVGVRSLKLSNNPGITDAGGRLLLAFVAHEKTLTDVDLSGTSVSLQLQRELSEAADRNCMDDDRDDSRTASEFGADDRVQTYLADTKRFHAPSFKQIPSEMLHPPSPTHKYHRRANGALRASRGATTVGDATVDDLPMLREMCTSLVGAVRLFFGLYMWEVPAQTLIAAAMSAAVTGVPGVDSSPIVDMVLLSSAIAFLQRRLARPRRVQVVATSEEWQRRLPALRWLSETEGLLVSDDAGDVQDGVMRVVGAVYKAYKWSLHEGRRTLGVVLLGCYVVAAYFSASTLLFGIAACYFLHTPLHLLRKSSGEFVTQRLNPFARQDEGVTTQLVEAFGFTVTVQQLSGVQTRHSGGTTFVPFVQVKYNRTAWLSRKVPDEPYVWNETSATVFRTASLPQKLVVSVYDDSCEVIAPAMHGFVIIDECTPLNQDIDVRLAVAQREQSLVHELIENVQRHDNDARRKYGAGNAVQRATHSSLAIEQPGTITLRINRFDDDAGQATVPMDVTAPLQLRQISPPLAVAGHAAPAASSREASALGAHSAESLVTESIRSSRATSMRSSRADAPIVFQSSGSQEV